MPTRCAQWMLLVLSLASGCWTAQGQVSNPDYRPLKLPSGDPFPSSEAELLRMRDNPDGEAIRRMRAHAWDIFAGLVGGPQPVWDTWYSKCDLHLETEKCTPQQKNEVPDDRHLLRGLEIPTQSLNDLEGLVPDSELKAAGPNAAAIAPSGPYKEALEALIGDLRTRRQVAEVIFNQEAADNITNNCLYPDSDSGTPSRKPGCPPLPTAPGKVPSFARGAVALKTIWAIVGPDLSEIPAYRAELWNEIHSEKDKPGDFGRKIRVDFGVRTCQGDYGDEAVPLECFYHIKLTKSVLATIQTGIVHLVYGNDWKEGNYLVLLGLHVTTKEIGDWVWATFWWNNKVSGEWHSNGRPNILGSPWNHYLMDTTLSGMTPFEQDGGPKICFNPFLETSFTIPHGIISNCLQCHSKAAFGGTPKVNPYKLGVLGRDGQRLASGDHPVPEYFDTMVSTDFLWSIAKAQDGQLKKVLSDLLYVVQDLK